MNAVYTWLSQKQTPKYGVLNTLLQKSEMLTFDSYA